MSLRALKNVSTSAGTGLAIWEFTASWSELRNDFHAFRVDRISAKKETGECFSDVPGQDLQAWESARQRFSEVMDSEVAALIIMFCSEILFHIA